VKALGSCGGTPRGEDGSRTFEIAVGRCNRLPQRKPVATLLKSFRHEKMNIGGGIMPETIDDMLNDLEPSIERVRAELQRTAERDIVLRRLLRGLLDARFEREEDVRAAKIESGFEAQKRAAGKK
jgi:hypothetical protein